ncbi:heparan-alpha-glucosaminide N-acetyltransferase [Aureococcus anophagefferens]|nr:heparan-alpha-glucosaminide N-acetyltransferase [Aureococcus anophagefferens]
MASQTQAKPPSITWDEVTIAEHDKDRGTRQKIDEPDTPRAAGAGPPRGADAFASLAAFRSCRGGGLATADDGVFFGALALLVAAYLAMTYLTPVPTYRVGGSDVACGGIRGALGPGAAPRASTTARSSAARTSTPTAPTRLPACSSCAPAVPKASAGLLWTPSCCAATAALCGFALTAAVALLGDLADGGDDAKFRAARASRPPAAREESASSSSSSARRASWTRASARST